MCIRISLILAALLLAGCLKTIEYVDRPVEVRVIVPVSCITKDRIPGEPRWYMQYLGPEYDLPTLVDGLLVEREQSKIHIRELSAIIEGCIDHE